jgi:hypothetical protein
MGPELLRVKDLARLSNCYLPEDFQTALKVLDRIYLRRTHGIVIVRDGAGKEIVPSSSRSKSDTGGTATVAVEPRSDDIGNRTGIN